MSQWKAAKARRVLAALLRNGWIQVRQVGSHRILRKPGQRDFLFTYHDSDEVGPALLARLGKRTGLQPGDL